jgi:tetratricopeptide (TPR) repeat protein
MHKQLLAIVAAAGIGFTGTAHAMDAAHMAHQPHGMAAARARIYAHDYKDAIPLLVEVLKQTPNDANALNLMGFSLRMSGKTQEALAYYDRALAIEPKHLGANEYLGELYVELGQIGKAKERLAVLEGACGNQCVETRQLKIAIARGERRQQQSRR